VHKLSGQWKCVFAMAVCAAMLHAQTGDRTTAIGGTVLDVTGKPIPSAAVTLKNEATGAVHQVVASADGKFSAEHLAAGVYTIEVSAPSFASSRRTGVTAGATGSNDLKISLNVGELSQSITVEGAVSVAAELSPSQNTLEARSAKSEISPEFIQNFASPVADYTELLQAAPGTFQRQPPTALGSATARHFFEASTTGFTRWRWTVFRSTIPMIRRITRGHSSRANSLPESTSIAVRGRRQPSGPRTSAIDQPAVPQRAVRDGHPGDGVVRILQYAHAGAGFFFRAVRRKEQEIEPDDQPAPDLSDGYQTYNYQKRVAGFIKYQYRLNDRTTFTLFSGLVDLWTNTPNLKGPTRAAVAQFGDDYLLSGDPNRSDYYGYNFYHVQTDFSLSASIPNSDTAGSSTTRPTRIVTGTSRIIRTARRSRRPAPSTS
jgi:iron complex outermembrane receptor protein